MTSTREFECDTGECQDDLTIYNTPNMPQHRLKSCLYATLRTLADPVVPRNWRLPPLRTRSFQPAQSPPQLWLDLALPSPVHPICQIGALTSAPVSLLVGGTVRYLISKIAPDLLSRRQIHPTLLLSCRNPSIVKAQNIQLVHQSRGIHPLRSPILYSRTSKLSFRIPGILSNHVCTRSR